MITIDLKLTHNGGHRLIACLMGLEIKLDKSTIVRRKRKFLKVVHTKQTI